MLRKFPGLFCVDELPTERSEVIVLGRYRSEQIFGNEHPQEGNLKDFRGYEESRWGGLVAVPRIERGTRGL